MSGSTITSKKRKRQSSADLTGDLLSFVISPDQSKNALKPLLATTPSIPLPNDASLTLYSESKDSSGKSKSKGKASSMLHGESSKLEWSSSNRLFGAGEKDNDTNTEAEEIFGDGQCSTSYALAIYDPSTQTLSTIPAPLHILCHIPKRLKYLPSMQSQSIQGQSNATARAELGLSFGTKKNIRAIRAAERNKVDAGAKDLQDLREVVMEQLDSGLETLASSQPALAAVPDGADPKTAAAALAAGHAVESATRAGRPVANLSAGKPEDVYRMFGSIILEKEMEAINVSSLTRISAEEKEKAITLLPYRKSKWVNDRIKDCVVSERKDRKRRMKVLTWISALMQLKGTKGGIDPIDETILRKKFGGGAGNVVPPDCIRSLLERFAEGVRGARNRLVTPVSKTRLLCHLFVACLYLDSYTHLDISLLANDLSLSSKKAVEMLKSLGCRIATPKGQETDRILSTWKNEGYTTESAVGGRLKTANLKVPLEFPKEKSGKAPAKR
ncbi:MAG: DNA-directed RNA polymerase I subunit rpa49 [Cyphobasidiales sp. Tagirdzhanova-0007]|nr:MAG: DNA-directed RNA polymerase I subunit rpa49 [Cyphobasidiales sp. Tagirdzhanova-0007]